MSNKLVKHQEAKEILTGNQKKILFWICFIILSIAFITVWINILLTSKAFNTQMEEMVLGEDYYMEAVSYTHLDVYKRQILYMAEGKNPRTPVKSRVCGMCRHSSAG